MLVDNQKMDVHALLGFGYCLPKLLLLFLWRLLLQDTGALQEPHLTNTVYQ